MDRAEEGASAQADAQSEAGPTPEPASSPSEVEVSDTPRHAPSSKDSAKVAPADAPARSTPAAAAATGELLPGVVIAGRYRIDRRVGDGSMGQVWAGEHLSVGLPVAIKALAPAAQQTPEIVTRFKREAQLLGRIRSDSVARVIDFIADEQYGMLLVMEFVAGEPLSKVLASRGRLSVEEAVQLGADLAGALAELHRVHIVHRDLKPANIMVEAGAEGGFRVVLVDFGAGRMLSAGDTEDSGDDTLTSITRVDMAIGTIEYMAPEQMLNSRDVTEACDVYALGAILHRVVAGEHVFGPMNEGKLVRAKLLDDPPPLRTGRSDPLAAGLERVVARALRKMPNERYPSAEAMAAELTSLRKTSAATTPSAEATSRAPSVEPAPVESVESRVPDFDDDLTAAPFELIPRDAMLVSPDELLEEEPVTARQVGPMRAIAPAASTAAERTAPAAYNLRERAEQPGAITGTRTATMPSLIPLALPTDTPRSAPTWERAMMGTVGAVMILMLVIGAAIRLGGPSSASATAPQLSAQRMDDVFDAPLRRANAHAHARVEPVATSLSALPDAPEPRKPRKTVPAAAASAATAPAASAPSAPVKSGNEAGSRSAAADAAKSTAAPASSGAAQPQVAAAAGEGTSP